MVSEIDQVINYNPQSANKNASDYPKERQSVDTGIPTTDFSEVIWISLVEEKKNTVEKGLIQGQKGEDRLSREQPYQLGTKQSAAKKAEQEILVKTYRKAVGDIPVQIHEDRSVPFRVLSEWQDFYISCAVIGLPFEE